MPPARQPLIFGEVLFDRFPDGNVVLGGADGDAIADASALLAAGNRRLAGLVLALGLVLVGVAAPRTARWTTAGLAVLLVSALVAAAGLGYIRLPFAAVVKILAARAFDQPAWIAHYEPVWSVVVTDVHDRRTDETVAELPAGADDSLPQTIRALEMCHATTLFLPPIAIDTHSGSAGGPGGVAELCRVRPAGTGRRAFERGVLWRIADLGRQRDL